MVLSFSSSRDYCRRFLPLRILTSAEPDFRICWMKLFSIVITTAPCVFFNRQYNKFGETCSFVFSFLSFLFTGICPWDFISPGAKSVRSKWKKKQKQSSYDTVELFIVKFERVFQLEIFLGFFLFLGLLSRTVTIRKTAGEGGGYLFNSSLPLPPASQTLNHWVARRSTQPFILPRLIKWVPGLSGNLVVESKLLPPRSGSVALRQLNPIRKKGS